MHLLPVYYSTTNTRKRKQKKKTASVLEAERQHAKFLKKMGIGSRSSVGSEQRPSKPWVTGSSPVESTNNIGGVAQLGERVLCKHQVRSSILLISTKISFIISLLLNQNQMCIVVNVDLSVLLQCINLTVSLFLRTTKNLQQRLQK